MSHHCSVVLLFPFFFLFFFFVIFPIISFFLHVFFFHFRFIFLPNFIWPNLVLAICRLAKSSETTWPNFVLAKVGLALGEHGQRVENRGKNWGENRRRKGRRQEGKKEGKKEKRGNREKWKKRKKGKQEKGKKERKEGSHFSSSFFFLVYSLVRRCFMPRRDGVRWMFQMGGSRFSVDHSPNPFSGRWHQVAGRQINSSRDQPGVDGVNRVFGPRMQRPQDEHHPDEALEVARSKVSSLEAALAAMGNH